jgi:hypothetical protein
VANIALPYGEFPARTHVVNSPPDRRALNTLVGSRQNFRGHYGAQLAARPTHVGFTHPYSGDRAR